MKYIILTAMVIALTLCTACTITDNKSKEHKATSDSISRATSSESAVNLSDEEENSSALLPTPPKPPHTSVSSTDVSDSTKQGEIAVNISDVSNNPVNDVTVEVFNDKNELMHIYQTNSKGEFILTDILKCKTYDFSVIMFSTDDKRVIERLSHNIAETSSTVSLKLSNISTSSDFYKANSRIDIYVVDNKNSPIADAYVNANPIKSVHPQTNEYRQTNTDKDGRITIISPQMTEYSLEISKGNLKLTDTFTITQEITKLVYTLK